MAKNEGQGFRDLGGAFRKAADIMDELADNIEAEDADKKQKEEKQDELLAKFMVQMMKIQKLQNDL